MAEVKLLGSWPSPYSQRVIWALKLKGIPYEYIAENLPHKSPLLLQSNPVHKKIPVLLHYDKPICESLIILEYIDQTWPQNPLLPADPHDRALTRFWAKFVNETLDAALIKVFVGTGKEELEKAREECWEALRMIEEHGLAGKKFFGGDEIGMTDLVLGITTLWLDCIEETTGTKVKDSDMFPRLHAWTDNFMGAPIIKDNLPDREPMLVAFKSRREMFMAYK